MSRKVFTLDINENVKEKSTKAKKEGLKVVTKTATADFGVAEINNSSAKKRVQQTKTIGFEKNICEAKRKPIKSKIHEVDDYFDFCFKVEPKTTVSVALAEKPVAKTEKVVEEKPKTTSKTTKSTVKAESKTAKKVTSKSAEPKAKVVKKAEEVESQPKAKKVVKKTEPAKKATTTKKVLDKKETKTTVKKATTKKVAAKKTVSKKVAKVIAEEVAIAKNDITAFEREEVDEEILRIVSIARMGALFDCEKTCE